jgi:hypothetical protein
MSWQEVAQGTLRVMTKPAPKRAQDPSESPETPEEFYTPEQLEWGRRFMVRLRQAAVLARERLREKEAQERLAALPPASRFIN